MEPSPKPADTTSTAPKKRGKGMWIGIAAVVIIILVVAGLYFTGYFSGQTVNVNIVDSGGSNPCPNKTSGTGCKFNPLNFPTTTGTKVTWKNTGGVAHTVTFNATANGSLPAPSSADSGSLDPGLTFQATFSAAGTYHYYCSIHSWMNATVTVT